MSYIATTRFNSETWNSNKRWRELNNFDGCIYGTPVEIKQSTQFGCKIYVLEMNNNSNIIEGIGLIINNPGKKIRIYNDNNYNRYIYSGKCRIDKKEFNLEEQNIIKILEILLFRGCRHMKRGQSITVLPSWISNYKSLKNIQEEENKRDKKIQNMFKNEENRIKKNRIKEDTRLLEIKENKIKEEKIIEENIRNEMRELNGTEEHPLKIHFKEIRVNELKEENNRLKKERNITEEKEKEKIIERRYKEDKIRELKIKQDKSKEKIRREKRINDFNNILIYKTKLLLDYNIDSKLIFDFIINLNDSFNLKNLIRNMFIRKYK